MSTLTKCFVRCDSCGTATDDGGHENHFQARAAAYASGWRFPSRKKADGAPSKETNDVCPKRLDGWDPPAATDRWANRRRAGRDEPGEEMSDAARALMTDLDEIALAEECASALRAARQAEDAIERVRVLHRDDHGLCSECTDALGVPWPCATVRALKIPVNTIDGADPRTKEQR